MPYSYGRDEPKFRRKNNVAKATIMGMFLNGTKEIDPNKPRNGREIEELREDEDNKT